MDVFEAFCEFMLEDEGIRVPVSRAVCPRCDGRNVVEVLADCASDEIREAWAKWQADERSSRAEAAAECRMGA
jgi:hypothetical protein